MGYRSDVYLAFHKTLLPFWLAHVNDEHLKMIEKDADTYDFFEEDDDWCVIVLGCVKWYGSYDDVKAIEKAFEYFNEHQDYELFQYLRVGEEFDDVEQNGWAGKFRIERNVTIE